MMFYDSAEDHCRLQTAHRSSVVADKLEKTASFGRIIDLKPRRKSMYEADGCSGHAKIQMARIMERPRSDEPRPNGRFSLPGTERAKPQRTSRPQGIKPCDARRPEDHCRSNGIDFERVKSTRNGLRRAHARRAAKRRRPDRDAV